MYLFGLEGSGFIISLALTFLISGAIMFYCLQRFRVLENTILEQGRILQSFIIRMQQNNVQVKSEQFTNNTNDVSDKKDENSYNLIEVSDDELDRESENDSNSEYDSSNESESDYNSTLNKTINLDINELGNELVKDFGKESDNELGIELSSELDNGLGKESDNELGIELSSELDNGLGKEFGIESNNLVNNESVKIISIEDLQPELLNTSILNINSSNSELSFDTDSNNSEENDSSSEKDKLNIEGEVQNEINKGGISKMKVSDLRVLAYQKGLVVSMDNANKLKKPNLIKLLQTK